MSAGTPTRAAHCSITNSCSGMRKHDHSICDGCGTAIETPTAVALREGRVAVSYTHLTLPTICSV
eukprot:15137749-Alexandrium_andersonii.AAC.1